MWKGFEVYTHTTCGVGLVLQASPLSVELFKGKYQVPMGFPRILSWLVENVQLILTLFSISEVISSYLFVVGRMICHPLIPGAENE